MKTKTQLFLELWIEARTRFTNQLEAITATDVTKKLAPSPNSVGFLIRHMGEVELLFAKNVFGASNVKITAKTVIDKYDTDGAYSGLTRMQRVDKSSMVKLLRLRRFLILVPRKCDFLSRLLFIFIL